MVLHPEFIEDNGKKSFAILPYEEFVVVQGLIDDALDEIEMCDAKEKSKGQDFFSLDEVKAKLLGR